jgi:hypothetical protein
MAPHSDLQEAYEACCPASDQVNVVLDGKQYTIHCRDEFGVNCTPQQEFSNLVSCARQCTKTTGCKSLQWDMSEKCLLILDELMTKSKPRTIAMVQSQESLGDEYGQEIERLKSEKASLEKKKEEAEQWLSLCERLNQDIVEKRQSCEKFVAQAFGHRDSTLNALFQEATLDISGAKFKLYFGKSYGVGTVADGVGLLKHQHSFTSCLKACSRDDDCKAANYDPESQECHIVDKWKHIGSVIPDMYDGRSISAIRVERKWELVVASKARKVLDAIYRALSSM